MGPEDVPERSNFWFSQKTKTNLEGKLFDSTSILVSIILTVFSFVIFWPVITQIHIEEAFFTPLVPSMLYFFGLWQIPSEESMKILFIISFMVSTVGIYLFVREMTKRQMTAIISTLIYLIPPVPIFVLTYFRQGLFVKELEAAKLFLFIIYGDGAHFIALALIPFAAIFFLRYLKSDHRTNLFWSAIFCALIFLATRSQAMSLILILASITLSELFLGMARVKIKRFLLVIAALFGLIMFWYTPDFLIESFILYRIQIVENINFLFPIPFILGILMLFFTFVIFGKKESRQPIFISLMLFTVYLLIIGTWIINQRSFMPHVQRLIANLNMFTAIILAIGITYIVDKAHLNERFGITKWSYAYKSLAVIVFWPLLFLIIGLVVYLVSPPILEFFSGSESVWSRIGTQVIEDRQHIIDIAGSNFKLIARSNESWQLIGLLISILTILALVFMVFVNKLTKGTKEDKVVKPIPANNINDEE